MIRENNRFSPQGRSQAAAVLSEALETAISGEHNVFRSELDSWDSLKHLELIMLIEERFSLRLSVEQALALDSLDDIVNLIEGES